MSEIDSGVTLLMAERLPTANIIEPFVVSLDPLSISEAMRLADAFGVDNADAFWTSVSDGGYAFMATRPLDLGWMVRLWNEKRGFGTYLELVEFNIQNRLTEVNPSYLTTRAVLSPDQLRFGAEELAAASELSGRAYIATEYLPIDMANEVAPSSVLSDWKPNEVVRLLASAVFDEATFGRVRFHHRIIRAYLAACWLNRQLAVVPLHRFLPLFVSSPFGTTVLIPNRRWMLCWLTAINVEAREWITQHFPEMFLFDGDPESWDSPTADKAFMAYVQRLKNGFRTDWHNDPSEYRRVGRRLSPGLVPTLLKSPELPARVTTALLPIVQFGHLTNCAELVFDIYRNAESGESERRHALDVLEVIATPEQRTIIMEELISGLLTTNDLIASALPVVAWQEFSAEQFVSIFKATQSEQGYGAGPMARALKVDLLPKANATSAEILLLAVLEALPAPDPGKRFTRIHDSDQPERAWLLDVLPDCFERLLTLLPRTNINYPEICIDAAERLESLRDTGFTDQEDFRRIHALVAEHPELRWKIAIEIALSENISHSTSRLVWGMDCIVSFTVADVPQLLAIANDDLTGPDVRNIWFTICSDLVFRALRGQARTAALAALVTGPEVEERRYLIVSKRTDLIYGAQSRRIWKSQNIARKRAEHAQHKTNRIQLMGDIEQIRDARHKGSLRWLIQYSYDHAGRESLTRVDYPLIERDFGQSVAEALAAGLKIEWSSTEVPNPEDYTDGRVPWDALAALAGLHTLLEEGKEIESLCKEDVGRAAKLAVWELNGPPKWFEPLACAHSSVVAEALWPWIENEVQVSTDTHRFRGALEMVLRCSTEVAATLLFPLAPMVTDGRIRHPELLKAVVKALRAGSLLTSNILAKFYYDRMVGSISSNGLIGELHWLLSWLEEDPANAWSWFEDYVTHAPSIAGELVNAFARMAYGCRWITQPVDAASADVLLRLYQLLTQNQPLPDAPVAPEDMGTFGHVINDFRSRIPNILVQSRGIVAHEALIELMTAETDPNAKQWLITQLMEHTTLEALQTSPIEPRNLKNICSPFLIAPESEAQLYEQVIARLEEVQMGIEEGPFSDRALFTPEIPEKYLQNWLAARFRETQSRKFTVSREEEVDDDKEPDIQLGCPKGKVCVEIKPLSRHRRYSASSLTETLRTQIVSQYLKGFNSQHGILVLFRLDGKTWDIPGGAKNQPFSALVEYLQIQATNIMAESPAVKALTVFGIDCVS